MQYLVTVKVIYGVPFAVEAQGAEEALQSVVQGKAESGPPFILSSLPITQWSVEPLEFVDALTKMYNALHGVVSMFNTGMYGVDFEDERVMAVFNALNDAAEVIKTSSAIQKELSDRESSGSMPSEDS